MTTFVDRKTFSITHDGVIASGASGHASLTDRLWSWEEIVATINEIAQKPGRPKTYKRKDPTTGKEDAGIMLSEIGGFPAKWNPRARGAL